MNLNKIIVDLKLIIGKENLTPLKGFGFMVEDCKMNTVTFDSSI